MKILKILENPNKEIVSSIRKRLVVTNNQCPCKPETEWTEDTICPCKEFREQDTEGYCHCQLYRKVT